MSYHELSTPLTVEHFDARDGGRFYGLAATPDRYRVKGLGARTPIPGLFPAGSDVETPGIIGALMGGPAAATAVRGSNFYMKAAGKARAFATGKVVKNEELQDGAASRDTVHPYRYSAVLTEKQEVTPLVYDVAFALDRPMSYRPGQYAKLEAAPFEWRDFYLCGLPEMVNDALQLLHRRGARSIYTERF